LERSLVISSQLSNINIVREFLQEFYLEFNLRRDSFNQVFLGISEAVNNAILHGNKLDPGKIVYVRKNLDGNQFLVEVEDEGEGFCESELIDPTLPESLKLEYGRGIYIIRQLADELAFKEDGRKVIIQFTLPE
jgi:serine/threonine-protein kinase RsbW